MNKAIFEENGGDPQSFPGWWNRCRTRPGHSGQGRNQFDKFVTCSGQVGVHSAGADEIPLWAENEAG